MNKGMTVFCDLIRKVAEINKTVTFCSYVIHCSGPLKDTLLPTLLASRTLTLFLLGGVS